MREGLNPLRDERLDFMIPPDVPVVAIITHLPKLQGYHEYRLEIVQAAIESAYQNAGVDHHFIVWDNGSCDELRARLYLDSNKYNVIFSPNIGKMNAINRIYGMYNGSVISISDDDILHYPGWLQPQIDVLEAYDAAMVTGCVTRHYMKYKHLYGFRWARENRVRLEVDGDVPLKWDLQHGESIGKDAEFSKMIYQHIPATRMVYNGVVARVGGCHCQFLGRADTLRPFFPITDRYMQPLYPVDIAIDEARLLRLMTENRLTRHLGNRLTDEDRKEINDVVG